LIFVYPDPENAGSIVFDSRSLYWVPNYPSLTPIQTQSRICLEV
jgi:hypothetical protein